MVGFQWPNGAGKQHLYSVTADVLAGGTAVVSTTTRQIGFRAIAFVTEDDSDPAKVAAKGEGTGAFTMRFKVRTPFFCMASA